MKAIFFDLDDTLYNKKQYYLGAFKEISKYLSKRYKFPPQKLYKCLIELWKEKTSVYPYLFDDLLRALQIGDSGSVKNIVKIFNGYKSKLKPYQGVIPTLKKLRKQGYKLGIITDGNIKRQKRKIKLLGIKNFFEAIVYTKEIASKPSKRVFLVAIKKLKVNPENAFYVADNPLIDFEGAKKNGMRTIRLKRGEFARIPKNKYIDFEVKKLKEVLHLVKR